MKLFVSYLGHDPVIMHQNEIHSFLDNPQERHQITLSDSTPTGKLLGNGRITLQGIKQCFYPVLFYIIRKKLFKKVPSSCWWYARPGYSQIRISLIGSRLCGVSLLRTWVSSFVQCPRLSLFLYIRLLISKRILWNIKGIMRYFKFFNGFFQDIYLVTELVYVFEKFKVLQKEYG